MVAPIFPILTSSFSWVLAVTGSVGFFSDTSWLIYVPFGLLLLIVILVAPYGLWREQQARADEAEEKLKPRISVKPIVVDYGQLACIRVTNLGNETIRNCVGYLRAVYREANNKGLRRKKLIPPVCLRWSTRHGGEDKRKELTFIREADLNVVEIRYRGRVFLYVFNKDLYEPDNVGQRYQIEDDSLVFDIEIVADNSGPIHQKYKFKIVPTEHSSNKLEFDIFDCEVNNS